MQRQSSELSLVVYKQFKDCRSPNNRVGTARTCVQVNAHIFVSAHTGTCLCMHVRVHVHMLMFAHVQKIYALKHQNLSTVKTFDVYKSLLTM